MRVVDLDIQLIPAIIACGFRRSGFTVHALDQFAIARNFCAVVTHVISANVCNGNSRTRSKPRQGTGSAKTIVLVEQSVSFVRSRASRHRVRELSRSQRAVVGDSIAWRQGTL
jgi:hypothetical protein